MTLIEFLAAIKEDTPQWLLDFEEGDSFPREVLLASRIMYYPGPSLDGHGVRVFSSSHSEHCFVHADYDLYQHEVEQELQPAGSSTTCGTFTDEVTELNTVAPGYGTPEQT
jgi:hypothetical protein